MVKRYLGMSEAEYASFMEGKEIREKLLTPYNVVAQGPMRAQVGKFTLVGDGLCVGYDSGDPVSAQYKSPGELKGATVQSVTVSTGKIEYKDLQAEAERETMVE